MTLQNSDVLAELTAAVRSMLNHERPETLTLAQLADLLQVPRSTAYDAVRRGDIPGCRKVGKHLRFHRPTVLDWLAGDSDRVPRSGKRRTP